MRTDARMPSFLKLVEKPSSKEDEGSTLVVDLPLLPVRMRETAVSRHA
jgi:hypothetical protein